MRQPTITLHDKSETPSQAIAKAAQETATVTDKRGRALTVGRLDALSYYRLTKAMGQTATNTATMELASIAAAVREIDGEPVAFRTENEIEFLIKRLDFDGLEAAAEGLKKLNTTDVGTEAAKN
jgi:hypothetical protein